MQKQPASLATKSKRVISAHVRPNRGPGRTFSRSLKAIGTAHPDRDMMPLAAKIVARFQKNRQLAEEGSWLLADKQGRAYVLVDGLPTTRKVVRANSEMVVGRYYAGTARIPEVIDVFNDLVQQFIDNGMVTVPDIYEAIRMVEG